MNSSQSSSSGLSRVKPVDMVCDCSTSLMRLLVLGVQLESWLVTSILAALICGNEFSLEKVSSS